jgi:hypothetical protein
VIQVGILVHGELRCLGAPTDLKGTLCGGYVVEAHLPEGRGGEFGARLQANLPGAEVVVSNEAASDVVVVSLRGGDLNVPRLFEVAEAAHEELEGSGYAVAQASLEQVFMQIAHGEEEEAEEEDEEEEVHRC